MERGTLSPAKLEKEKLEKEKLLKKKLEKERLDKEKLEKDGQGRELAVPQILAFFDILEDIRDKIKVN